MQPWSLVYTFFRSLSLAHLERSLYSLSKQTIKPDEMIFYDNNTDFSEREIRDVIGKHFNVDDWEMVFDKHRDPKRTSASYAQNASIRMAKNEIFLNAKADLIYAFDFCEKLVGAQEGNPNIFASCWLLQMDYLTPGVTHETVDHAADLEPLGWREDPRRLNLHRKGAQEHPHAVQDAPGFCTTKRCMDLAGWYDENLIGWGFWQIGLQAKMLKAGVQFRIWPEFLYFHMQHAIEHGERSLDKAREEWNASPLRTPQDIMK